VVVVVVVAVVTEPVALVVVVEIALGSFDLSTLQSVHPVFEEAQGGS
jgi:hypothetical protein